MATVLPKETPINNIPIQQGINPTDYLLINNGTLNLVPWSTIVISADQTDFYTSILSISSAQINNTVNTATLSATIINNSPNWNSTYSTVNNLSSSWVGVPTAMLVLQGFKSNSAANYDGTGAQIQGGIVVGFNGSYTNTFINVNNASQQISNFQENACIKFQPGTYRISGSIKSTSGVNIKSQYVLVFYNSIPGVNNNATYTISTAPVAQIYSTVESTNLTSTTGSVTNTHIIDSYVYINSVSYGILLYVNNDANTSANTGVGTQNTLSIRNLGTSPAYGGCINLTYISQTNTFNITSSSESSVVVRPNL